MSAGVPPAAASIAVSVCVHGTLTIELLDADRAVLATASFPAVDVPSLVAVIEREVADWRDGDGFGPCEGHG